MIVVFFPPPGVARFKAMDYLYRRGFLTLRSFGHRAPTLVPRGYELVKTKQKNYLIQWVSIQGKTKRMKLEEKFLKQQREIARLTVEVHDWKLERNKTFQLLMQEVHGLKPGDKITFRGKERTFKGTFDSYRTDNEDFDPRRAAPNEVLAVWKDDHDGNQYNTTPKELEKK